LARHLLPHHLILEPQLFGLLPCDLNIGARLLAGYVSPCDIKEALSGCLDRQETEKKRKSQNDPHIFPLAAESKTQMPGSDE
jgi:hypothetical protein